MTKWGYKIINVGTNNLVQEASIILKELGNQGLELIAIDLNSF
ncbi:hypothetical protein N8081_00820 [Pseudomonadota bacterium]|nr:hypothetical protein [Pseudomonadota bacterium]